MKRKRNVFLASALVSLACGAVLATTAQAVPAWYFNEEELVGSETILASAIKSTLSIPGLTTKCATFQLKIAISNSAGTGIGSVNEVPIANCSTSDPACTVKVIQAEKLPWSVALKTVSGSPYILIGGVKISLLYEGSLCVLEGVLVTIAGSAGGLYTNAIETITFSPSTFKTTGTKLSALGNPVEWSSIFTTEALEFHNGEELTIE